jgi:hypothetical protein
MTGKRLCPHDGIRRVKGGKLLCSVHIDAFFRGEQIKWAPKRLLSWEIERRAAAAIERMRINELNKEYYNGM